MLAKLREGGMGTIYKVHHNLLDEVRVIKFMRAAVSGDADLHRRFLQEAKLVTRFKHPNIAAVYDFAVDDDDTAYIVMEYVDGLNLSEASAALHPLSVPLVLELTAQTLDALGYLHRKNVVHRDISPDNIMAIVEDGSVKVKLIDLGIAKALDSDDAGTKTGFFIGKLKYASPEQLGTLRDDDRLDGRSDLYSLGVVMYELLTEKLPFSGTSAQALIAAHLLQPPEPFDENDAGGRIPQQVRDLVLRALSKDRNDRFTSADEMRRAIIAVQQHLPPEPLTAEAAKLRTAMLEQDEQRAIAAAATPSAQERMNRRFALSERTPRPGSGTRNSADSVTVGPTIAKRGSPTEQVAPSTLDATVAVTPLPKSAPRTRWIAATSTAAFALVLAIGALVARQRSDEAPAVAAAQTTIAAVTSAPLPAPTETTVSVTESAMTPLSTVAPAIVAPPVTVAAKPRVEEKPTRVATVREPEPRPTPPVVTAPAMIPRPTRTAPTPAPEPVHDRPVPEKPAPEKPAQERPTPIERPREVAPAPVEERAPAPRPVAPSPSADSAVREVIREFVAAQEALDVASYVAVFPSANRARIGAAFESFRSQKLDLTIESIDINGNRATVRAREERIATPKVGSVQRLNANRVIQLQRNDGRWVVASIQ